MHLKNVHPATKQFTIAIRVELIGTVLVNGLLNGIIQIGRIQLLSLLTTSDVAVVTRFPGLEPNPKGVAQKARHELIPRHLNGSRLPVLNLDDGRAIDTSGVAAVVV